MKAKKPAPQAAPVVVRLPKKVIAAIDKAANKNCRTRSSEIRSRVVQSLAAEAGT